MEATKRPWTVEGPKHEHYHASIMGADGHLIVNIGDGGNGRDVQLANAALIVQAVNTFDQAREALKSTLAALVAAISLLERGGKAAKKAAPSDKMFNQMMRDYKNAVVNARKALAAMEETP